MKKIPTLFKREFEHHRVASISEEVIPGLEWVLEGKGLATIKWDGSCCMIQDGVFYKRYDAKRGKPIPEGAIPCQEEADAVTGHFPCWVECRREDPGDKWYWAAYDNSTERGEGTYEAVGPHFQSNPYQLQEEQLIPHGKDVVKVERSIEGIFDYLTKHEIEGLVFWKDGVPQCKIKRKDFGLKWPVKKDGEL